MQKIEYVVNPETQRHIRVDGPTYAKLKKKYNLENAERIFKSGPKQHYIGSVTSGHKLEQMSEMGVHQPDVKKSRGRGGRTRGWGDDAPKRGNERHLLKEQCGDQCFLMPDDEGFPICRRCLNNACSCKIDCRGLTSAKIRAHQHQYNEVYQAAEALEKKINCGRGRSNTQK